jgi:predicted RND superfamily exporter protein
MSETHGGSALNWVRRLHRWSLGATLLLTLLACVGFYLGSGVKLKLSLTDLLPDDHPAVINFEKINSIVGGVGYLIVMLEARDKRSHLAVAPALVEAVRKNPDVRTVFFGREEAFFRDRLLYYLTLEQLNDLEYSISTQITKAKRKAFDIGLWEEDPGGAKGAVPIDNELKEAAQRSAKVTSELISKDERFVLLMIKPAFDSMDLERTKKLVDYTEGLLREKLPQQVTYELTGRYYAKVYETDIIQKDIFSLGLLSVGLVLVILFLYLRSWRGLVLVFVPVMLGLGITGGFTRIHIGHINLITGFLVGIVSGLGVDYGIHLLLRLRMEVKYPSGALATPIERTLLTSGHSIFVGAMAAAFSFYLLCFSSFRAFSEFGFICGTGIVSVFVSLLVAFPLLARVLKLDQPETRDRTPLPLPKLPLLEGRMRLALGVVITLVLVLMSLGVEFEYDFSKMLQHSKKVADLNRLVDEIYERSTAPSALATSDRDTAVAVEDFIKQGYMKKDGNGYRIVSQLISGATIVPEDQEKKQKILEKIASHLSEMRDRWIEKSIDISALAIRKWVSARPFSFSDIPLQVQDALRGLGQKDYLILVYPDPKVNLDTAQGVYAFAGLFRALEKRFKGRPLLSGSDAVVFADILDMIGTDGFVLLLVMILAIGIFIRVNVSRWRDLWWTYLPLLVALPVGMGLMKVFGVRFNIFNISIIPTFVAMGIDVPVHIVHRARETGSGFKAARDLSASINLSLMTAGVGFGVLVFARTGVLKSLGWIALMGTFGIWWVGLIVLPACLEMFRSRKAEHIDSEPVLDGMAAN